LVKNSGEEDIGQLHQDTAISLQGYPEHPEHLEHLEQAGTPGTLIFSAFYFYLSRNFFMNSSGKLNEKLNAGDFNIILTAKATKREPQRSQSA
jgi:hypothetical protein